MFHRLWIVVLTLLSGVAFPGTPWAVESTPVRQELNLKHRVERLEKSRPVEASRAEGREMDGALRFHGLVELEARYRGGATDPALATVELGLDYQLKRLIDVHVLALYEEDETTPPELDELILTWRQRGDSGFSFALGRLYVPFGYYDSVLIDDPLTLELGETRRTAIELGYRRQDLGLTLFGFDGDERRVFGLGLNYQREEELGDYRLGWSWISDLRESDGLGEALGRQDSGRAAPAWSAYLGWRRGGLEGIAEYLAASGAVSAMGSDVVDPAAWNLELDYTVSRDSRNLKFALAWQKTRDASDLGLPRSRWLAGLSAQIGRGVTFALQYAKDRDDKATDRGEEKCYNAVTAQLAIVF